jgi:integrase
MSGSAIVKGLYEKRGWFYFQPATPKQGKRPPAVALKTRDLVEALQVMEETQLAMNQERVTVAGTLAEVLPRYYLAKGGDAKSTRRCRQMALDAFQEACGNPRLEAIDARLIDGWRRGLSEKGGKGGKPVSGSTVKSYTIILRAFLNWAVGQKLIRTNPMAGMSREVRVMTTRVQGFLTEEEREKLLAAEAPDYVRLILMLGFFAGLRDGEMLALKPQWLWIADDGLRGTLTVQTTPIEYTDGKAGMWAPKCRKNRTLPLHPRLLKFLKGYGMREPWLLAPEKPQWPTEKKNSKRFDAKRALAGVAKRAGVRKLTPHMLRHSFATHLSMKGVPLAEIAGLLGDSLRVTEEHYAGYQPGKGNPLGVL